MFPLEYRSFAFAMLVISLFLPDAANAEQFEKPPEFNASAVVSADQIPAGVTIASPVISDGLLRIYTVDTPYGQFVFDGDGYAKQRLKELMAVERLSQAELNDEFKSSFEKSLREPVEFVQGAVQNPTGAVKKTISGVSRLFDRAAAGIRNAGEGPDNIAASLLGVSKAKREIAVSLGVDPYSDFGPLKERLERAAQASAAGGLTVKGLFMLIPGGAGVAVSSVSTASDIATLIRDKTASELMEINRSRLRRAAGNVPSINLFLENPHYTLGDQAVVAAALLKLREVKNVNAMLSRMASVIQKSQAIFLRERVRLTAEYSASDSEIAAFFDAGGLPLSRTVDGEIVTILPLDALAWTERSAGIFERVQTGLAGDGNASEKRLIITGEATPLAQERLGAAGWKVERKPN
ncbi:MAG: hypothetical protein ACR2OJ_09170 [Hyphomicrobiales bacterium]